MKSLKTLLLLFLPVVAYCQNDSLATKQDSLATHPNQATQSTQPIPPTQPPPAKQPHRSIGLGIIGGLNFTNVTSTADVSNKSETGYMVGLFLSPDSKSILGSRTELIYSHQAYDYATGETTGKIFLDYLMLSKFMAINITHFFQIQIGTNMGYLLSAKNDSSQSTGYAPADALLKYYNRFIFGFTGGVEVRPFMGIVAGARYNLNLTNLYKVPTSSDPNVPPNIPTTSDLNFKNNMVQVYLGYRF